MIPAKKKRQHRDKLQQQRHRNGTAWEEQLCEELNTLPPCLGPVLAKILARPALRYQRPDGRPRPGHRVQEHRPGNLPFSALRTNEIENLSRFEDAGGTALLAIRRDEPPTRAFVPWWTVRPRILAGDRGSIPLGSQPQTLAEVWEVSTP